MLAFLLRHALAWWRSKLLEGYIAATGKALRRRLLDKIFALGPSFAQKQGTGNLVTMTMEGIRRIENYLSLFGSKTVNVLVIPLMVLIYSLYLDSRSALTMFLVLPIVITFMVLLGQVARARATKQYRSYRTLANHFVDSLRGLETLKLLGLSANYAKTVGAVSDNYRRATMGTLTVAFMSGFALDFFSTISIAIIALFLGLRLLNGTLLLAPALTMLILAPEYFLPIREFGGDYHATLEGKKALEAVETVLSQPEIPADLNGQEIALWSESARITLTDISVGSDSPSDLSAASRLEKLSFSWQGHGKIGIIGASGAGKSTMIELLGGFLHPSSGAIRINTTLLSHLRHPTWQKQILYIPQRPYIFYASIADNIRFYTPWATDEQVSHAVRESGLGSLVASFPLGLQEPIGEGGRALSGGQEQRIALARAFLDSERRILLFDEPTAHVDIETEYELKKTMLPLMENRLVFFATHRLHWMQEMDWVLLIDNGCLVAQDRPEEMIQNGAYRALLRNTKKAKEVSE